MNEKKPGNTRKALVIINKKSSSGDRDVSSVLDCLRKEGFEVDVHSPDPEDVANLIRSERDEADTVIIGGGDGTINTASDAIVETGMTLGIIPLGTANDLAGTIGINSPMDLCKAISENDPVRINVGRVNGKHFFNTAHIGMSVEMAKNLTKQDKERFGFLAYIIKMSRTYWDSSEFDAEITCDGVKYSVKAMEIAVANGVRYGGGMVIHRNASLVSDTLNAYVIERQPFAELAMKIPAFYGGTLEGKKNIITLSGRKISIDTGDTRDVMVDGEIIGTTPCEFDFARKAVAVYASREYANKLKEGPMIRDDRSVALDKMSSALRDAQEQFGHHADLAEDAEYKDFFSKIAAEKKSLAEELEQGMREIDVLPKSPDPDKEAVEEIFDWFRSLVAEEKSDVLLGKAAELEIEVIGAAEESSEFDQPDKIAKVLEEVRRDSESNKAEIERRKTA